MQKSIAHMIPSVITHMRHCPHEKGRKKIVFVAVMVLYTSASLSVVQGLRLGFG
jgi:hypothetical protein